MSTPNRAAKLVKAHKILKKHYEPVPSQTDRTLLEHLLYACCLENASFEQADEAYARLQQSYFDWNEIRVTTVAELAEVLAVLTEPSAAAARLKRSLQSVFDAHYSFDLEPLKKQNIGKSVKRLEKYEGVSPFGVAFVTQHALAGHSIPADQGTLGVLLALAVITEAEAAKSHVPGMERAIPKNKGVEFASLLHQLGAEFFANPYSPKIKAILGEIDPESKDRLPKKPTKKEEEAAAAAQKEAAILKEEARRDALRKEAAAREAPKTSPKAKKEDPRKLQAAADDKKKPLAESARPEKKAGSTAADGDSKKKSASKSLAKKKPR